MGLRALAFAVYFGGARGRSRGSGEWERCDRCDGGMGALALESRIMMGVLVVRGRAAHDGGVDVGLAFVWGRRWG